MTFESMIDTPNVVAPANENANVANSIVNEEALAVKVSYGDEIRRATFTGTTYVALRDLCAKLFELDPATAVLKYQDDDGDKITVSTDGEVQDALQGAKEKKILRLFVDVKAPAIPAPIEEERPATDAFHGGWGHRGFPMRGGFHHRGGFMPGFPGARGFGHHGFPHGGPHHGFSHGGPHQAFTGGFPHHAPFAPATPVTTDQVPQPVQAGGPSANYRTPRMFGHGVFSPADAVPIHHRPPFSSPYARCAFKEHKHAMKEQLRMMKANAATEEDRQAIKDFKDQMKAECKARWHEMKEEKKIHKEGWKAEKKTYKGDWKAEKAQWKEDKKCEKNDRLVARHVADVTVPDNSELPADTPVTKTWRLRNAGLLAWPADSQLLFISRRGDNLNGPERIPVGAVEPNQEVEVSVTFITPSEPGRYIGYYRMATGEGSKFGQRVWVSFIIPPTAGAPAVDPTAPLLPNASPAPTFAPLPASPLLPSAPLAKAPDAADDVTMD